MEEENKETVKESANKKIQSLTEAIVSATNETKKEMLKLINELNIERITRDLKNPKLTYQEAIVMEIQVGTALNMIILLMAREQLLKKVENK
jgi:signal recognition particle subunit SEC65